MSVTIHYSGNLQDRILQNKLFQDMLDMCSRMNWQVEKVEPGLDDHAHPPVRGLFFLPHEHCEAVSFLFNDDGDLVHLSTLAAYDPTLKAQRQVSVKTQLASPDIHIVVVHLLRFIKTKYIPALQVVDEGEFWEREDRTLLEHLFRISDEKLTKTQSVLDASSGKWRPSQSGQLLLNQIDTILAALLKGDVDLKSIDETPPEKDFTNWDVSLN